MPDFWPNGHEIWFGSLWWTSVLMGFYVHQPLSRGFLVQIHGQMTFLGFKDGFPWFMKSHCQTWLPVFAIGFWVSTMLPFNQQTVCVFAGLSLVKVSFGNGREGGREKRNVPLGSKFLGFLKPNRKESQIWFPYGSLRAQMGFRFSWSQCTSPNARGGFLLLSFQQQAWL